jgi:phosphate transport system substrate-binding protein
LSRLFSGEIGNWFELGGSDAEVELHLGDPATGLSRFFIETVLTASGLELSGDAVIHGSDRDVVAAVMTNPAAIGLVSFERVGNAVPLPLAGQCGLFDVATLNTVKTGDYPLTVPLYLYLPPWRLGPFGREFIDWLSGAEAQRIMRRIGVPGEVASPIPVADQGDRIVSAIQRAGDELGLGPLLSLADVIQGRERLTPTFRFEPGRSTLDPSSLARVRALARAIAEGRYSGQELLLAGFSDGLGSASMNLVLSEARAEAVRDAILDALGGTLPAGQVLDTVALGEVMPVSCDETGWGQQVNRRVELWVSAGR